MSTLMDQAARDAIAQDLDSTLVVEAGAGTGKTTALVSRMLALIVTGRARLVSMIAVTFTEKASGEMRLRLRTEIERARQLAKPGSPEAERLTQALTELEVAEIGTLHGLAANLLRRHPVQAEVDPLFTVASEAESERIYSAAFELWFQAELAQPSEGVRRVLRRRGIEVRDSGSAREQLYDAGKRLLDVRDFDGAWSAPVFDREQELDRMLGLLSDLCALAPKTPDSDDYLAQNIVAARSTLEDVLRKERVSPARDHDALEEALRSMMRGYTKRQWTYRKTRKSAWTISVDTVIAKRDAFRTQLEALIALLDASLAAQLQHALQPLVNAYAVLLAKSGKVDFLDLLLRTRALLTEHPDVAGSLSARYTHVLVDEFQDTDPLQADIVLALAKGKQGGLLEPGKLFVVGDPKQSIYRFRRADVQFYERIKKDLVAQGAKVVYLQSNFRCVRDIVGFVNAAFDGVMTPQERGTQAAYVPIHGGRDPSRCGMPPVVALPVPAPYSPNTGKVSTYYVSQSYPDAVAAYVRWLLQESKYTIREGDTERALEGRDVCILFRRLSAFGEDVTRPYVRALEANQLSHVLVGGRSFHAREEVLAVENVLAAIEWPDDELSVYAALRGPFMAHADETLLAYRTVTGGALMPLRKVEVETLPEALREVLPSMELLRTLHYARNRRPIADTVSAFLEATRAHTGVAFWPAGEQALGNLLRLVDHARRFELRGTTSFRAFVQQMVRERETARGAEAPVVEEGSDGVRMMTVHKAKGLEFPVVILADPGAPFASEYPSRYVDTEKRVWAMPLAYASPGDLRDNAKAVLAADADESLRLLYVAATRARDMLVVPIVGDERLPESWVTPLYPATYPKRKSQRAPLPATGCPAFGEDTVLLRPDKTRAGTVDAVKPGLHTPEKGSHGVVFWDPAVLKLGREEDLGVRQQRILSAPSEGATSGEDAARAWRERRSHAHTEGAKSVLASVSITGFVQTAGSAEAPSITMEELPRETSRPTGARFGTLVHAVLASLEDGGAKSANALAQYWARHLGAPTEEVHAATAVAEAFLQSSLCKRMHNAREVHREMPLFLQRDGVTLEGVADLVLVEDKSVLVVDFKTDTPSEATRALYQRQLALYAASLSASYGLPCEGMLLLV
jgi:ATP-dependent helicase/nuclease subunit A